MSDRDYSGPYKPFSISGYLAQLALYDLMLFKVTGVTLDDIARKAMYGNGPHEPIPPYLPEEEIQKRLRERYHAMYPGEMRLGETDEEIDQRLEAQFHARYPGFPRYKPPKK